MRDPNLPKSLYTAKIHFINLEKNKKLYEIFKISGGQKRNNKLCLEKN